MEGIGHSARHPTEKFPHCLLWFYYLPRDDDEDVSRGVCSVASYLVGLTVVLMKKTFWESSGARTF